MRAALLLIWSILLCFSLLLPEVSFAEVPEVVTHQGRLIQNGVPLEGELKVEFAIISAQNGPSELFAEIHNVVFVNGYYSVVLGASEANKLSSSLQGVGSYSVRITLNPEGEGVVLDPPQAITSSPFSLVSFSVEGGTASVTEVTIKDTARGDILVINDAGQWVGESIDGSHIQNEAITQAKINNNAVTSDKILDGSVSSDDISSNAINSSHIADGSVSSADIQDESIQGVDIALESISSNHINPRGGVYAGKGSVYKRIMEFNVTNSIPVTSALVACDDVNDMAINGSCNTLPGSDARFFGSEAFNWSSTTTPASFRCSFTKENPGLVGAAANITCLHVD